MRSWQHRSLRTAPMVNWILKNPAWLRVIAITLNLLLGGKTIYDVYDHGDPDYYWLSALKASMHFVLAHQCWHLGRRYPDRSKG